jgi:ankyrin repeat protein
MLAASSGKTDIAVALLRAGASANSRDLFGRTPLHDAAMRANAPLTQLLLTRGADPRLATDGGNTPLHLAARGGHPAIAVMLARAGADLQARNAAGATPQDLARSQRHWSTAERLSQLARGEPTTPVEGSADDALAYRTSALDTSDGVPGLSEPGARPKE